MGMAGKVDAVTRAHLEKERQELMAKAGVSTWKLFAPMMQMPVFIGFFIALRRMAANVESFNTGGVAWFTDLSLADPTWVLPVISTTLIISAFELGLRYGSNTQLDTSKIPNNVMKYIKWGMRVFLVAVLPFVGKFPAVCCNKLYVIFFFPGVVYVLDSQQYLPNYSSLFVAFALLQAFVQDPRNRPSFCQATACKCLQS